MRQNHCKLFLAIFLVVIFHGSDAKPAIDVDSKALQHASANHVQRRSAMTTEQAMDYLRKYNHMPESDTEADLYNAIMSFQSMSNMNATGELDANTAEMMDKPRCGVQDNMGTADRMRRFDAMNRWPTDEITWRVNSFTNDLTREQVTTTISRALGLWAEYSKLRFRHVTDVNIAVDFDIDFKRRDHGDGPNEGLQFDGRGGVLAHAFFPGNNKKPGPLEGDVHFDLDEYFTLKSHGGTNFYQLTLHELGHSLGLGHSEFMDAVMSPFYGEYDPDFTLHKDDIAGIRYLYGRAGGRPKPDVTMRPNPDQPTCPRNGIDAIVATDDDWIFAFKGELVWKLNVKDGIARGWPKEITAVFDGLDKVPEFNGIDAALFFRGKFHLFVGSNVFIYTATINFVGKFSIRSQWHGVPDNIDAAFTWSGNGKIYFIKGNKYYRYNTHWKKVDWGYPLPLHKWHLGFDKVDAVLQWGHSPTYFFSGPDYYRYNDKHSRPEKGYPRRIDQYWFGCGFSNLVQGGGAVASVIPNVTLVALIVIRSLFALF